MVEAPHAYSDLRAEAAESRPKIWSVEEFERLPDDLLPQGERLELIEGQIYTKMGQNDPHVTALRAVDAALRAAYAEGFVFSIQTPLQLGSSSKPEPDLYLMRGSWRDYDGRRPDPAKDVVLLVEVSDASLTDDRTRKAQLYAKHGVPEYWIVNLRDRTLEVRRGPRQEHGDWFESRIFHEDQAIAVNGREIAVVDLLPRA